MTQTAGTQTLRRVRELVEPSLYASVQRLPAAMRTIAGYHLGWWDERGRPAETGGKAIRPALVVTSAEAVGAPAEVAVGAAVAVELVHNFSLLHDDVIDGDTTRRHRATAWAVFGTPAAILAGDAMLTLAFGVLAAQPRAQLSVSRLSATLLDLIGGESDDVAFERRSDVSLDECLAMAEAKTATLLGCACELGALSGDASPRQAEQLRRFGHHLGLAFQMVDDLLGIWGEPGATGKAAGTDLRTRKKSIPVVAALTSGSDPGERLAALYRRGGPLTDPEVRTAARLVEQAGGRSWTEKEAHRQVTTALSYLESPRLDPAATGRLSELAYLVLDRYR